ncbi:MAG: urease accessory protein UreF [Rhizobiaceae bacterium]|nr:urease accessory protein UreF [Rhizobiaceae bacterium]
MITTSTTMASATPMGARRAIRIMATTTADGGGRTLLRLLAWLSPAFPVGSFSYSHGLESAVAEGLVKDAHGLRCWIEALIRHGSGWNDAVLLAEAARVAHAGGELAPVSELAEALAGSAERHRESQLQGGAFLRAASAWDAAIAGRLPGGCAYCVAVGAVAGHHALPLTQLLQAYLQAFATNLVQAAIRLGVTGQEGAVSLIALLEETLVDVAGCAARSSLDDLGGCSFVSDVAAMRHETQYSRLFRS